MRYNLCFTLQITNPETCSQIPLFFVGNLCTFSEFSLQHKNIKNTKSVFLMMLLTTTSPCDIHPPIPTKIVYAYLVLVPATCIVHLFLVFNWRD